MKRVIAFADEYGNNSFDFVSQGKYFIVSSIIVSYEELDLFNCELEKIRIKYFQKGEIKSNKVSDNHKRRELILKSIQSLNFSIYAIVVNKEKLWGEGFKYKKSFYKFVNGILYKELYRTFPNQLDLIVDEHGGNDFMKSFKNYVQNNHIRTLFSGSEFEVKKSHNELGVQLADFIAGTLGYIIDERKASESSEKFKDLLRDKLITLNEFPRRYDFSEFNEENSFSEFDDTIATMSISRIYDYLDNTEGSNQRNLDNINFLKILLLFHQSNHYKKYNTSSEFIRHLNINRDRNLTKEQFAKIIANLRDKGILIASGRGGYKIPTSVNELKSFIRHGNSIIIPMLRRIVECRNAVLLGTNKKYDIIEELEFSKIKNLVDNIKI